MSYAPPKAKGKGKGRPPGPAPPATCEGRAPVRPADAPRGGPGGKQSQPATLQGLVPWRKLDSDRKADNAWTGAAQRCKDGICTQIEADPLRELFSRNLPEKCVSDQRRSRVQRLPALSKNRSFTISVGLRSCKGMDFDELHDAIRYLDPSVLTLELTERLLEPSVLPTNEEFESARNVAAELGQGLHTKGFDEASRFLLTMHDIPHYQHRLLLHYYWFTFDDRVKELREMLATVRSALDQVRSSDSLADIFYLALAAGNVINEGTKHAGANAFGLESLPKLMLLKQTKGGGSLTFVDYIASLMSVSRPEMIKTARSELSDLERGCLFEVCEVNQIVGSMLGDIRRILELQDSGDGSRHTPRTNGDGLGKWGTVQMSSPMVQRRTQEMACVLEQLQAEVKDVKATHVAVAGYYGEARWKAEKMKVHEWLGYINRFLEEIQNAEKRQHEAQMLQQRRDQQLEMRLVLQAKCLRGRDATPERKRFEMDGEKATSTPTKTSPKTNRRRQRARNRRSGQWSSPQQNGSKADPLASPPRPKLWRRPAAAAVPPTSLVEEPVLGLSPIMPRGAARQPLVELAEETPKASGTVEDRSAVAKENVAPTAASVPRGPAKYYYEAPPGATAQRTPPAACSSKVGPGPLEGHTVPNVQNHAGVQLRGSLGSYYEERIEAVTRSASAVKERISAARSEERMEAKRSISAARERISAARSGERMEALKSISAAKERILAATVAEAEAAQRGYDQARKPANVHEEALTGQLAAAERLRIRIQGAQLALD